MFLNPYVIQVDKFAESLKHLSNTFLKLEDYRSTFTKEENEDMFKKVTEKVCANCENREVCLGEKHFQTYQMMYEILCAVEEYGAELNIELKRRLQKPVSYTHLDVYKRQSKHKAEEIRKLLEDEMGQGKVRLGTG